MTDSPLSGSFDYEKLEVIIGDDYTCQSCGAQGGPKGSSELHVHDESTLCRSCYFDELFSPDYPLETVSDVVNAELKKKPFVSAEDVSAALDCARETAVSKLDQLVESGELFSHDVGPLRVWYPRESHQQVNTPVKEGVEVSDGETVKDSNQEARMGGEQTSGSSTRDGSSGNSENDDGEIVLFFPSRREIVVKNPSNDVKRILSQVSHLVDSVGNGYMYKVDEEDIWNAPYDEFEELKSDLQSVVGEEKWSPSFEDRIQDEWERATKFRLETRFDGDNSYTVLSSKTEEAHENVAKRKLEYNDHYVEFLSDTEMRIKSGAEADVKETLYSEGYPVVDERRLDEGSSLRIDLEGVELRGYQQEWVQHFMARKNGVFVGPSGSGKTVAAIGVMDELESETLIIVPQRELAQQWEDELLERTTLSSRQIGQYHGDTKQIRPVTIATYDIVAMSRHRKVFNQREWGLVIADEAHHAPASTWKRFREIQSTARLGLSATPVRQGGNSKEIYTLIGPPVGSNWGQLFDEGWVEEPTVTLVTVPWASESHRESYQSAEGTQKLISAAKNPSKVDAIKDLFEKHESETIIVFADWVEQGQELSEELGIPFVYGETPHSKREQLYEEVKEGERERLIVSRVGEEGIDLPNAEVAILASTAGSSSTKTGQRAGRTMRPVGGAEVYIILTRGSSEVDWGRESTQFLSQKGVDVRREDWY